MLNSPEALEVLGRFREVAEMTPFEFLHLLGGEHVFAVNFQAVDGGLPRPHVFYGVALGENRERVEAIVNRLLDADQLKEGVRIEANEFRGATIHTLFQHPEDGADEETLSYAFVDDVAWLGYPRAAVEECIVNLAAGGADAPITATDSEAGKILARNASADAGCYVDLRRLVALGLEVYKAMNTTKDDLAAAVEAGPDGDDGDGDAATPAPAPSMLQQMGLTPDVIVHALGLDELRMAYLTVAMSEEAIDSVAGLTWGEQRGLLRAVAYGDAPAPQPEYVAAGWQSVAAARFNLSGILDALKDAARTANPMLEFMITQNLAGVKQQTGIDLEADFFAALGDEVVIAQRLGDDNPSGGVDTEQLWAISLRDQKAFNNAVQTAWSLAPQVAQQLQDREYRGQMILSLTAPIPTGGGMTLKEIAYAVTPAHLLVDIGGSKMLEEALDRLNGEGESLWTQPAVSARVARVADRASSIQYQDTGPVLYALIRQLATAARLSRDAAAAASTPDPDADADSDAEAPKTPDMGLHRLIDPDAVPNRETIEKYFGATLSAVYRESDGVRVESHYENVP